MSKNPFIRKLSDIRYHYGINAQKYFLKHPICENCKENRISCLAIHHVNGKNNNIFKTLCHNCHALIHAHKSQSYTYNDYKSYLLFKKNKSLILKRKIKKAKQLNKKGYSLRRIAKELKVSHTMIKYYIISTNV